MVVSLTNAVNHPIKLTKPSVVVVNWRSMGGRAENLPFPLGYTAPRGRLRCGGWLVAYPLSLNHLGVKP
jgi:hypothetical protein